MKPLVYLAGPYSKPDPMVNIHEAIKLADRLLNVCVPFVPQLNGTWHMVSPKPYETWLEIDRVFLLRCDMVLRFGGASVGADREVNDAIEAEIPVFFSELELRVHLARAERALRAA